MIRAYKVSEEYEGRSIIVFSTSHNKAKVSVMGHDNFDGLEYIELSCRLAPKFESLNNNTEYIVDFCENSSLFCEAGWHCFACDDGECDVEECAFMRQKLQEEQL